MIQKTLPESPTPIPSRNVLGRVQLKRVLRREAGLAPGATRVLEEVFWRGPSAARPEATVLPLRRREPPNGRFQEES